MSIRYTETDGAQSRQSDDQGITLTVRDVYEGDPLAALIPPEIVVLHEDGRDILKEVDADANTWISADEMVSLKEKR